MVPLYKDNKEDICPICLDPVKEAVRTECGHLFCRMCLTQHMDKASVSGFLRCPVCRKPYSEGVLGDGYICFSHQKRVCMFCEASRHLLCVECLKSPEHQTHVELSIENAISHYKERLTRRSRKLRKDLGELQRLKAQEERMLHAPQVDWGSYRLGAELQSQDQTTEQLKALPQHRLDQQEDQPAEAVKIFHFSEAVTQLSSLISGLERMAKELDARTLKDASDLLDRSVPQKLEGLLSHLPPVDPNLS
uniref:E3 ubiquitin ligase TRIM40-like isoform X1 n=1 Tax=Myodes glareolus TaxID=447135 RepID=UPI00201FC78B|nr:E3 ubiquitin ligase TRIM40-like isoform X1 [Myodes glareolus]XP_048294299.1 E3 ubiquitin ligase TRIM40-like isoform X1 [Myodes glareolus]XP_048294300.1 E3 ubiquitin ligase TRIM40-like isoform X1 [Myodes glareolus]XP_048294301.1 E3 ubiquitin ligase TRIM40-like isoform X1 [Myodes glareolus]